MQRKLLVLVSLTLALHACGELKDAASKDSSPEDGDSAKTQSEPSEKPKDKDSVATIPEAIEGLYLAIHNTYISGKDIGNRSFDDKCDGEGTIRIAFTQDAEGSSDSLDVLVFGQNCRVIDDHLNASFSGEFVVESRGSMATKIILSKELSLVGTSREEEVTLKGCAVNLAIAATGHAGTICGQSYEAGPTPPDAPAIEGYDKFVERIKKSAGLCNFFNNDCDSTEFTFDYIARDFSRGNETMAGGYWTRYVIPYLGAKPLASKGAYLENGNASFVEYVPSVNLIYSVGLDDFGKFDADGTYTELVARDSKWSYSDGMAFDKKRNRLVISAEHVLYFYDLETAEWTERVHEVETTQYGELAYLTSTDKLYGVRYHHAVGIGQVDIYSAEGELEETIPLAETLPQEDAPRGMTQDFELKPLGQHLLLIYPDGNGIPLYYKIDPQGGEVETVFAEP